VPEPQPTVVRDVHGPVTVLRVNRPDVRNALDAPTLALLLRHLAEADASSDTRVVVLTGAGDKAFIAGADIAELAQRTMHTELGERARLMRDTCAMLETMGRPTVAAIHGYALGGGCEIALACDMRFASTDARLGLPEINLGLFPGGGGSQRLLRLCGRAVAAELMMTGAIVDADEAFRIGLVNRVVAPQDLLRVTLEVAERIASKSPFALRAIKDALRAGANSGQHEAILYENKLFALCMESEDKREGVAAYLEKRTPTFRGR
jgi:enoyl-CoA hydratase